MSRTSKIKLILITKFVAANEPIFIRLVFEKNNLC